MEAMGRARERIADVETIVADNTAQVVVAGVGLALLVGLIAAALAWALGASVVWWAAVGVVVGAALVVVSLIGALSAVARSFLAPAEPLESERLRIRTLRHGDGPLAEATVDEVVVARMGWRPRSVARLRRSLRLVGREVSHRYLAVCQRYGDEVIGIVAVKVVDRQGSTAEFGCWFSPTHRGQGLAAEMVNATVRLAHRAGIRTLICGTAIDNVAMRRALERNCATVTRQGPHQLSDGQVLDSVWYELDTAAVATGCG